MIIVYLHLKCLIISNIVPYHIAKFVINITQICIYIYNKLYRLSRASKGFFQELPLLCNWKCT
jgi:hypothetical protein